MYRRYWPFCLFFWGKLLNRLRPEAFWFGVGVKIRGLLDLLGVYIGKEKGGGWSFPCHFWPWGSVALSSTSFPPLLMSDQIRRQNEKMLGFFFFSLSH